MNAPMPQTPQDTLWTWPLGPNAKLAVKTPMRPDCGFAFDLVLQRRGQDGAWKPPFGLGLHRADGEALAAAILAICSGETPESPEQVHTAPAPSGTHGWSRESAARGRS